MTLGRIRSRISKIQELCPPEKHTDTVDLTLYDAVRLTYPRNEKVRELWDQLVPLLEELVTGQPAIDPHAICGHPVIGPIMIRFILEVEEERLRIANEGRC